MKFKLRDLPQLIIIGSGTGIPSLRRASPGLLLVSNQCKTLIDSGPGTLRKMLEVGLTYNDIDLLLYTHTHPDHVSDLVPILFASKYGELPRRKDLLCIGGPGFKRFFQKLRRTHGSWIEPHFYHLEIKETSRKPYLLNGLKVSSKPMAHLPESVGYRFEFKNGKSMAVSGDTDYCQNIVDLASEVDLLVLECSFPEGKKIEGHLTPSLAGRIAVESRCNKLLLYHLYPVCDQFDILSECKKVYKGEIILAEDLMKIPI